MSAPVHASEPPAPDPARQLLKQLWITKGARFEAERRLTATSVASVYAQSLLAAYVIVAGLLPLLIKDIGHPQLVNLLVVTTSIFLLALNILEAAQNYALRAERMLRCAQAISEIHNRLELKVSAGAAVVSDLQHTLEQYHAIMRDYSENHAHIDFHSFRANHPKNFHLDQWYRKIEVVRIRIMWHAHIYWKYAVVLAIPGVIIYFILRP